MKKNLINVFFYLNFWEREDIVRLESLCLNYEEENFMHMRCKPLGHWHTCRKVFITVDSNLGTSVVV